MSFYKRNLVAFYLFEMQRCTTGKSTTDRQRDRHRKEVSQIDRQTDRNADQSLFHLRFTG